MEQTRQAAMASREETFRESSGGKHQADGRQEELQSDEYQDDDKRVEKEDEDANPVLGGERVEGYQGFKYLFETVLTVYMDEDVKSGRIKRKTVSVYVPMGNDIRINGDFPGTVNSDTQGISFYADVDPGITFPKEDASIDEKLDSYIEHIYGSLDEESYNRTEVESSGSYKIGKNAAATTVVEYCTYRLQTGKPEL